MKKIILLASSCLSLLACSKFGSSAGDSLPVPAYTRPYSLEVDCLDYGTDSSYTFQWSGTGNPFYFKETKVPYSTRTYLLFAPGGAFPNFYLTWNAPDSSFGPFNGSGGLFNIYKYGATVMNYVGASVADTGSLSIVDSSGHEIATLSDSLSTVSITYQWDAYNNLLAITGFGLVCNPQNRDTIEVNFYVYYPDLRGTYQYID